MSARHRTVPAYAALQVTSNFSFLRGASHPEELVATAHELGLKAMALTDRNTLAGIVRGHVAAKQAGLPLIIGCRLDLQDGPSLLCYPGDRQAYGRLARLLSIGKRRAEKGACHLTLEDVCAHAAGQAFILLPPDDWQPEAFTTQTRTIAANLAVPCFLAAHHLYRGDDRRRIAELASIASSTGTPLIAVGDVLYHDAARRPLQDVVTCIREHCTVAEAGFRLNANAERYLRPASDMARLFAGHEDAIARALELAESCRFSLDELRYNYPQEPVPPGKTPHAHLEELTWAGAKVRYPQGVPGAVQKTLKKELALIHELGYALYFLTVHDITHWAREQSILCQGRGSAANSAVCYCLHITSVDPTEIDLLFERFISAERKEPPDIDVDFEHERREEVMQYIYRRYGRERAGIAATVIRYRARSAVREVGKVMGLSEDVTSALASTIWGWSSSGVPAHRVREAGLDPADVTLRRALALSAELIGFPRHLSQHVGGFVLTEDPLCEVVPIGNAAMADRTFVEWDKDDLNALGILKVDVLALGMLTCIRKCFDLMQRHLDEDVELASFFPATDKATYDMLCRADTVGVFQVESRAQMTMLPRLKPRKFYDLVIEIAIVRPGPIQGNMVHPYLRRRKGIEPVDYPSPDPACGPADELERVLKKTLGVPLFQEQAMRIAIDAAKFSPDEANALRHAMATFRRRGTIETLEEKMIGRLVERGYAPDFAKRCFDQIKGFGEYGFPESHSASFALLAYVSSWLKCHRPAVFACGLLNAQPMGFYAPAQIVRDAREHGVEVRAVDINMSEWDSTLELRDDGTQALRLGMRQISGMREDYAEAIVTERRDRYEDLSMLQRRADVPVAVIERLADADAFRSIGLDRREALWRARGLAKARPLPLFTHADMSERGAEPSVDLPTMSLPEHVIADYQTLRLSLKAHPMQLLRAYFTRHAVTSACELWNLKNGAKVAAAGVVLVRQRPGTAKGIIFMTLEDETGVTNVVVWPKAFETYRKVVMGSRLILVRGRIQAHDGVLHVVSDRLEDHSIMLHQLADAIVDTSPDATDNAAKQLAHANPRRHPRNVRIIPGSRDFH